MKIIFRGIAAEHRRHTESAATRIASPFAHGDSIEFVHCKGDLSIRVENAKYIASRRLEALLREQLPCFAGAHNRLD